MYIKDTETHRDTQKRENAKRVVDARFVPVPPSPTKTSLNVGTSAMMMNYYYYVRDLSSCF